MIPAALALAALAVAVAGTRAVMQMNVLAQPDEWLIHTRDGRVIRAGIGISAWRKPGDRVVQFTSTVQRVRFEVDGGDREGLPVRLSAFALWSVDPTDPCLAYQRLGLGHRPRASHLLERPQYHAFQQAFGALVLRHLGQFSLAEITHDPREFLQAVHRDAVSKLALLGARVEDLQLLSVRPVSDEVFAQWSAASEQAARTESERARLDASREIERWKTETERDRKAAELAAELALEQERAKVAEARNSAEDLALEAELARSQRRVEAEIAHLRLRNQAAAETPPEVRTYDLARLRTESMAAALGKLPLKEAKWISIQEPLDTVRNWLGVPDA